MAKGKRLRKAGEPKQSRKERKATRQAAGAEPPGPEENEGDLLEAIEAPPAARPTETLEPAPALEPPAVQEGPPGQEVIHLEGETSLEPSEVGVPGEEDEALEEAEGLDEEGRRLRKGMFRSRRLLTRPFVKAATKRAIDPEFWEEAEEALIAADTGVPCASAIVEGARRIILREGIREIDGIKDAFRREVVETIESFGAPPESPPVSPHVIFIVGVNGVGKTTTAAKLGNLLKERGDKVLFAAADTFRAAGIEQMEMWAQRVGAPVVRHKTGGDPAAVVFDAVESARARGTDVVIVDTAGRLHTKKNLMDELAKMWRVAERQLEGAAPEAILVIDATTGQNGVVQARIFSQALEVGSIALAKMDGSARGGVVMAIGRELGIPVAYIGVGEGISDLRPFDPEAYAAALYG